VRRLVGEAPVLAARAPSVSPGFAGRSTSAGSLRYTVEELELCAPSRSIR
jgi:hypothetical protein